MENNKVSTARVLIVDDMRVNRLILSSMLAAHNVESETADSGAQCLELCRNNAYDLILLDHRMPDTDGVETLIQLKEMFRRTGHDIPIICHTTEDARPNINLYKAAGFVDVLIKPIQPGGTLANVHQISAGRIFAERRRFRRTPPTESGAREIAELVAGF